MAKYKLHKKYIHKEDVIWVEDIEAPNHSEAKRMAKQIFHKMEKRGEWPWEIIPVLTCDDGSRWMMLANHWEEMSDKI